MLTPCQKCLRSFLTLPSAFILSDFVDYTEFSGVSFERRVICLPKGVSWQFEVRMDYYYEGDEDLGEEDHSEYGLYLTTSDGLESLIFHSQAIEHQIYSLNATDEAVRWLFDDVINEIGFRVVESMTESKQLVEIGSVIDRCLENWPLQLAHQSKANSEE